MSLKNRLKISSIIVLIFTGLDYLGHKFLETNVHLDIVNQQYYINKILFGIPILLVAFYLYDKLGFNWTKIQRTFLYTAILVFALQTRYSYTYSLTSNYYILTLHFVIVYPLIYYFYKNG